MIKEEAIEILSDMRAEYNIFSDDEEEATMYHALSWAIQALNECTGRWIPVSKGSPNPNEKENDCLVYYLVQNEYGDMMVAAYRGNTNGEIWWEQMYAYKPIKDEVIAWMPLPEPYKEEK